MELHIIHGVLRLPKDTKNGEDPKPNNNRIDAEKFSDLAFAIGVANDITSHADKIISNPVIQNAVRVQFFGSNVLVATMTIENMLVTINNEENFLSRSTLSNTFSLISSIAGAGAQMSLILGPVGATTSTVLSAISIGAGLLGYLSSDQVIGLYEEVVDPVVSKYFQGNISANYRGMMLTPDLNLVSPAAIKHDNRPVLMCYIDGRRVIRSPQRVDPEELVDIALPTPVVFGSTSSEESSSDGNIGGGGGNHPDDGLPEGNVHVGPIQPMGEW